MKLLGMALCLGLVAVMTPLTATSEAMNSSSKIFSYTPQEVTVSTVNTDQAAYTEWLYGLDDDTFNKIRMQGP